MRQPMPNFGCSTTEEEEEEEGGGGEYKFSNNYHFF
jgi:hypothetical protein